MAVVGLELALADHRSDVRQIQATEGESEAKRLLSEGIDLRSRGDPKEAIRAIDQALALYRSVGDRAGEGTALKELGNTYHTLSDYPKATELQRQALALARAAGLRDLECRALINLAGLARDQASLQDAEARYREAQALAREMASPGLEALASTGLGSILYRTGAYQDAAEALELGMRLARDTAQEPVQATAAAYLGRAWEALERYPLAIDAYREALGLARELGNREGELTLLTALASAFHRAGDHRSAIDFSTVALEKADERGDAGARSDAAVALGVLTASAAALGHVEDSLQHARQQLGAARQHGDRYLEGVAAESVGVAYLALGRYPESIEATTLMLEVARQLGDSTMEGKALRNLGQAYLSVGESARAADWFRQQLEAARSAQDWGQIFDAVQNLGDLAIQRGDYDAGVEFYEENRIAARQRGDRRWSVKTLNRLASAYHYLERYTEGARFAEEALTLARSVGDPWQEWRALQALGRIQTQLGDERGIDHLRSLVDLSTRLGIGSEHLALAELGRAQLALARYPQAAASLQKALKLARESGDRESEGTVLEQLAAVRVATGDLVMGERYLRDALGVWESLRAGLGELDLFKVSIFERQAATYRELQKVLLARNEPARALEVAERGRARAFVELLQRRLTPGSVPEVRAPSVEEIRRIAAAVNATLVEYSILDEDGSLLIWVVPPAGELTVRRVAIGKSARGYSSSLEALVRNSRYRLGARGVAGPMDSGVPEAGAAVMSGGDRPGKEVRGARRLGANGEEREAESPLRQLHRLLIEPISDSLPADPDAHVVFIPQGPLFLAPFAALQDASGGYLVARHTISTAPSIQVLDLATQQREADHTNAAPGREGSRLVVGNPFMAPTVGPAGPLPPLPGAEEEAKRVARLLGTQPLTGAAAAKAEVVGRMGAAVLIHLATHALLDDERGLGSAVVLGASGADDGLLTAEEISSMRLQADLVVLSACNTGRGRITGDGVIGLSRSFISSGVPSVVVSLWSVPDAPTADLMTEFYRQLDDHPDKAQALRRAMLSTMKDHGDPLSWAGFVLVGVAIP